MVMATPPSTALPDSGSRSWSSSKASMIGAGALCRYPQLRARQVVGQPCGRLTTPGIMSALTCTCACTLLVPRWRGAAFGQAVHPARP